MIGRLVTRLVDAQAAWARPFGDFNHRWLSALFRPIRPVKDFLNGTWLGHPVHAAITDVPIGALTVALVLDILGQPVGADVALLIGVLSMVAAAVVGLADYTDTDGTARMRATVHSVADGRRARAVRDLARDPRRQPDRSDRRVRRCSSSAIS